MAKAMHGVFREQETNAHVAARTDLLAGEPLPPPAWTPVAARAESFLDGGDAATLATLADRGVVLTRLDEPLTDDAFRAFGERLGSAMPELDPAVQPFVTDGVILNLVTTGPGTADADLAPFTTSYLSLHSEGSGRPADGQPRYIALLCHEPGGEGGAQTVLTSMAGVSDRLADHHRALLSRTRYRHGAGSPYVLRTIAGVDRYSFRDFMAQPLDWTYDGEDAGPDDVNAALLALLDAMYHRAGSVGVRWSRGLLAVIDNTRHFHGRTAATADPARTQRHLKRLRIVSSKGCQGVHAAVRI
ncbi:TauD/TfdA family dioxygenase [Longispora urticae]